LRERAAALTAIAHPDFNAGAERLQAINARLIYCSISGFGPTGPSAQRPAYDGVAQAASGLLSLLTTPENPRLVGPALADSLTAFYATYGILGALYERERTAHGRKVELSMLEAMTHFNLDAFTHFYQSGEIVGPYTRPSVSQTYALRCADGKWIALHMSSPEKFWVGLANVIERPTLLQDPRFDSREGRIANQAILAGVLADVVVRFDRAEWCARLEKADVPHSPMYDASDALEDPQAKHLELLINARHQTMGEFRTVRSPISYDGEQISPRSNY
jgi:crotonobetainyl-CoA:carnitine CoA-transferase CaiB-like acyl-CoA transferase